MARTTVEPIQNQRCGEALPLPGSKSHYTILHLSEYTELFWLQGMMVLLFNLVLP